MISMEPISILHLEDSDMDAKLVSSLLVSEGLPCEISRVESRDAFEKALKKGDVDLILSDYALPAYDGFSALAFAREFQPEVPFIFVSGTIGEEVAIDTIKSGATDYVLKQRLSRLVPSVRRALKEVQERGDRKKLESAVLQSEKMTALGHLAAGVAHELNNPLTVILGFAQSELRQKPGQESLVTIEREAQRCRKLLQDLLIFSRERGSHRQSEDPIDVIARPLALIEAQARAQRVEVTRRWPASLPRVMMDRGQIEQVVVSLCANALEAMKQGGTLKVRMNTVEGAPGKEPGWLEIEVADTGDGIPLDIRSQVFEPFFTTKAAGKGTGLGLSLSYQIIKKHNGRIEFTSDIGHGTQFRILLPL